MTEIEIIIDSFNLIENADQFLIEVLKKENNMIGGFGKFRTPNKEDKTIYGNNVADILVSNIWAKEIESLKLKKLDPENFSLPVPQSDESNLLLVSSQVVAGMNYDSIVSIKVNRICNDIETRYYRVKYFVPLP